MVTLAYGRETSSRIRARAAAIDPLSVALVLVGLLPYLLGYAARLVVRVAWVAVSHLVAAGIEGWQSGAGRRVGGG